MTEADLAALVVAYFQDLQYEVYQEVKPPRRDCVADVVAVLGSRPAIYHAVEVKQTLTLQVIAQAVYWREHVHYASIAVPKEKGRFDQPSKGRSLAYQVLNWKGVGCFTVDSQGRVRCMVAPTLNRRVNPDYWRLQEQQKSFAVAGNNEGRRWSPFQETCEELRGLLRKEGPLPLGTILSRIRHHYSSDAVARSSLMKWGRDGKIRGVRVDTDSQPFRFVLEPLGPAGT
jgi:hypothetical protein